MTSTRSAANIDERSHTHTRAHTETLYRQEKESKEGGVRTPEAALGSIGEQEDVWTHREISATCNVEMVRVMAAVREE